MEFLREMVLSLMAGIAFPVILIIAFFKSMFGT